MDRIRIKRGLDIPIAGAPEQSIRPGPRVRHVGLCGLDYPGLKPRVLVSEGESVSLGQPLFIDKRDPDVKYVAPGAGTVLAVNRGARRVLETIVIRLDEPAVRGSDAAGGGGGQNMDGEQLARRLQESGLWTAFRTRPYSHVPASGSSPRSIFVTAIDTAPLAPDPQVIVHPESAAFAHGLRAVSRLTEGAVYLCTAPGWAIPVPDIERVQHVEFKGPHPAGLPGTHIHHLDPVGADRTVWHIGYQEVIAIGQLLTTGQIPTQRVIAVGGERVKSPRLISTRLGASTDEILEADIDGQVPRRVISGSVLTGRIAAGANTYLGRYHNQISVIREGGARKLLGWLVGGLWKNQAFSTALNGRFTGMVPTRAFEKVMPLDILPSLLFRALLVMDTDQAQALGCLELDEEDLALCTYACPAKTDYGSALRANLDQIERDG